MRYFKSSSIAGIILFGLSILKPTALGNPRTAEELIAQLRAIPLADEPRGMHGDEFFDMHGNAIGELQALMKLRFAATRAICHELERPAQAPRYASALCDMLAFVKDPAAIPWMERRLHQPDAGILRDSLVGERWRTELYGAFPEDLKWIRQPDEWAAFFRRLIAEAGSEKERVPLERVLAGWFHDRETIAFFAQLEKTASPESEELFCAQLYLHQHKLPYDPAKTAASIAALRSSEAGRKQLLEYADELRDPAFIPWLIEIVEPATEEVNVGGAQWILEEITFCRGISGRTNWRRWFEQHKDEGRAQWIAAAFADLKTIAAADPRAAHQTLKDAVYRWKDRAALPHMQTLIAEPELAADLVGWINLSYHPFWRAELKALAAEVTLRHRAVLPPWAIDRLQGLDFIPHKPIEWEDYVVSSNISL